MISRVASTVVRRTWRLALVCTCLVAGAQTAQAQAKDLVNVTVTSPDAKRYVMPSPRPLSTDQVMLRIEMQVVGSTGSKNITELEIREFNSDPTNGDVSSVKVYYTGTTSTFTSPTLVATPGAFASGENAKVTATFTAINLPGDASSYLWVTYDIAAGATVGNTVGAALDAGSLSGDENWIQAPFEPALAREVIAVDWFVNDASTANDRICTAVGAALPGNTGKTPGDPVDSLESLVADATPTTGFRATLTPGEVIFVDSGDYQITAQVDIDGTVVPSGSAGNYVVFRGARDPSTGAHLSHLHDQAATATAGQIVFVSNTSYVELRDLEISAGQTSTDTGDGIRVYDSANVRIDGCYVHDNLLNGIHCRDLSTGGDDLAHEIVNCKVESNGSAGFGNGVLFVQIQSGKVQDCVLANNARDGFQAADQSGNTTVERCHVYDNGRHGVLFLAFANGTTGRASLNPTVRDCTVHGHKSTVSTTMPVGIYVAEDCDSATLTGNVVYDNWVGIGFGGFGNPGSETSSLGADSGTATNNTVYSTVVGANAAAFRFFGSRSWALKNNIVHVDAQSAGSLTALDLVTKPPPGGSTKSEGTSDYNTLRVLGGATTAQIDGTSNATLANLQSNLDISTITFYDTNSIATDPLFHDVDGPDDVVGGANADDDFHLISLYGTYGPTAGQFTFEGLLTFTPISGTFQAGEIVKGSISGAIGRVFAVGTNDLRLTLLSGSFASGETITGDTSGATATTSAVPVGSPAIDAGNPGDAVGAETAPNANLINQGAYGGTIEASRSTGGTNSQPVLDLNAPEPDTGEAARRRDVERIVIDFTDANAPPVGDFALWLTARETSAPANEYVLLSNASHGSDGQNGASKLTVVQITAGKYQALVYWNPPDALTLGAYDLKVTVADAGSGGFAPLSASNDYGDGDNAAELLVTDAAIALTPMNGARFDTVLPKFTFEETEPTVGNAVEFHIEIDDSPDFLSPLETVETVNAGNPPGFAPDSSASPYAARTVVEYTYQGTTALSPGTVYYWHVRANVGAGYGAFSERRSFTVATAGPPPPASPLADFFQNIDLQFKEGSTQNLNVAPGELSIANPGTDGTATLLTPLLNVSALHLGKITNRPEKWSTFEVTGPLTTSSDIVKVELWEHTRADALVPSVDVALGSISYTGAATSVILTEAQFGSAADTVNKLYYLRITLSAVTGAGPKVTSVRGEGVNVAATTAVTLSNLTATPFDGEVLVEWRTAAELNNAGFNVYRSELPDRDFALISSSSGVIIGLGDDTVGGAYYFRDQTAQNAVTYYYLVEDVEFGGHVTLHGPVSATPQGALGPAVLNGPYVNWQINDGTAGWPNGDAANADGSQTPEHFPVGPGVRVTQNDPQGFDIEIDVPRFVRGSVTAGAPPGAWDTVTIDGYNDSTDVGFPVVPTRNLLIEIPPVVSASLSNITVTSETHAGYALPALWINPASPPPTTLDAPSPSAAPWPSAALTVNGVFQQGERTLLSVRVDPVSFTVDTGELTYLSKIQARVDYGAWTSPAPSASAEEALQGALAVTGGALTIRVSQDGIYRVTQADLLAAGFDVSKDPRLLWLYNLGRAVSIRVDGEADGALDSGDALEFFGQRNQTSFLDTPETRYSDTNVYWLTWGSTAGPRVPDVDAVPAGSQAPSTRTTRNVRHEQQNAIRRRGFGAEGKDHWFIERLDGLPTPPGGNSAVTYGLDVWAPDAPENAVLRYRLRGGSELVGTNDHVVDVDLNGVPLETVTFDGESELTRTLPVSGLLFGNNTVTFSMQGVATSRIYVDWIDLTYGARMVSEDRASLRFSVDGVGPQRIENFATNDVEVWDVSDPCAPRRLVTAAPADANAIVGVGGALTAGASYELAFDTSAGAFATRPVQDALAVTGAAKLAPDALTLHTATQGLRTAWHAADYLVVTDRSLQVAADRLAAYRQGRGLRTEVVYVDEIMDEFAFGNYDPDAIQRFLKHAYEFWILPRLKYVCLLGDGHYDYHDHFGTAAPNLVPARMLEGEFRWAASDNFYAAIVGNDDLPDVLIGRLPVKTPVEADRLLNKIEGYESLPFDASWGERSLYVADDPDFNDYHDAANDLMARLPPGHTKVRAYFPDDGTATEIRQTVVDTVNAPGVLLTVYAGHGNTTTWASEDLFSTTRWLPGPAIENDLDLLTNTGRPTIGIVLNCLSGDFAFNDPTLTTLSEGWLNHDGGGAVAFWSSTGETPPEGQRLLSTHLYDVLFAERQGVLGDALLEAKLRLAADGNYDDVVTTWGLLGDPALSVYAPQRQLAQPNPLPPPPRRRARLSIFGCTLGASASPGGAALPLLLLLIVLLVGRNLSSHRRRGSHPARTANRSAPCASRPTARACSRSAACGCRAACAPGTPRRGGSWAAASTAPATTCQPA